MAGVGGFQRDGFMVNIENGLDDKQGQQLFRNFMNTSKMNDGLKKLNFWNHCNKLLTPGKLNLSEVGALIEEADQVEELNLTNVERLMRARDSGNAGEISTALRALKTETANALGAEYQMFLTHSFP